jgi:DNA-directed RNA polymerase subunit alpha
MTESLQDFFLGCKECVLENPRSFYGSFSLGPFKNSQSLTIANALRRTLLTEISNIAITHVEIDGVLHEYWPIEGVRESVLDILLNFKQIVLKTSLPFTKPIYGYLNIRGPGIVRASDLRLPPHIQYVDPDQYIATLNENGKLSLKFQISDFCNSSKQKVFPEFLTNLNSSEKLNSIEFQNKEKKSNSLWVDPNFNPILKVNYLIENLEPISQNFQNQVIHIEIWTNGSIHPRKTLYLTFDFLKNIFNKFDDMKYVNSQFQNKFFESEETLMKILKTYEYDFGFYDVLNSKKLKVFTNSPYFLQNKNFLKFEGSLSDNLQPIHDHELETSADQKYISILEKESENLLQNENIKKEKQSSSSAKNQFLPIETLNLPVRITRCLIQNNLLTIEDLLNFYPKELQKFCGFGNFSLCLIQKKLKKRGFFLKN